MANFETGSMKYKPFYVLFSIYRCGSRTDDQETPTNGEPERQQQPRPGSVRCLKPTLQQMTLLGWSLILHHR